MDLPPSQLSEVRVNPLFLGFFYRRHIYTDILLCLFKVRMTAAIMLNLLYNKKIRKV